MCSFPLLYGNDRYQGNVARVLIAEPERIGLQRQQLSDLLENARRGLPVDWSDPALEALAVLSPEHPTVLQAWQEIQKLLTHGRSRAGDPVSPETYFAIAYAAVDNTEILKQIERNLDRLDEIGGSRYDNAFTRHVTRRLRRDPAAADIIRQAVMSATTPHARAAPLVSLLAAAVGLDEGVLREVERRISDLKWHQAGTVSGRPYRFGHSLGSNNLHAHRGHSVGRTVSVTCLHFMGQQSDLSPAAGSKAACSRPGRRNSR